ncbi:MAG: OmpH family outer membrane protein [Alphaproteobacteria bacterium]|nr:OmpH family outer membrane protein [Alphaproteobacteria bacterium]
MAKFKNEKINEFAQKYSKTGIIAAVVILVAALGSWGIYALSNRSVDVSEVIESVSADATNAASLRIAVVHMDAIQTKAKALDSLRKQRESYENKLRDELTSQQKKLEKEKAEIEKSQDVLSRDALQRRVVDYQNRVNDLQRELAERAQSIETSYQKALSEIQTKHLDPVIEGIIKKKNLSLVIDGRFARTNAKVKNLDITDEVVNALNKKVSSVKMSTPKGF